MGHPTPLLFKPFLCWCAIVSSWTQVPLICPLLCRMTQISIKLQSKNCTFSKTQKISTSFLHFMKQCHSLTQQLTTRTAQSLTCSSHSQWVGEENGKKVKLLGWDKNSLTRQKRKLVRTTAIRVKKNMWNKLYTINFFLPPDKVLCSHSPSSDDGTHGFTDFVDFTDFANLWISQNSPNS